MLTGGTGLPRLGHRPGAAWRRGIRCGRWRGRARRGMSWRASPAEFIPGDLTDPASIAEAVRGCGAVIHCAADYRIFVPDPAGCGR